MAFSAAEIAERDKRKRALMDKLFGSKASAGTTQNSSQSGGPGITAYDKPSAEKKRFMPFSELPVVKALANYGNAYSQGLDQVNNPTAKEAVPQGVPAAQPQDKENYAQSITGLGQGINPYPGGPSTERKMTGEAAVQQKPNGSLVQIVPDKPQAPAVAAPPPISEYAYERITPGGGLEGVSSDGQVSSIAGWMDEPKNRTVKYRGPVVPGAFQWGDIEESTYGGEKIRRAPDLDVQRLANQGGIDRQQIANQGGKEQAKIYADSRGATPDTTKAKADYVSDGMRLAYEQYILSPDSTPKQVSEFRRSLMDSFNEMGGTSKNSGRIRTMLNGKRAWKDDKFYYDEGGNKIRKIK